MKDRKHLYVWIGAKNGHVWSVMVIVFANGIGRQTRFFINIRSLIFGEKLSTKLAMHLLINKIFAVSLIKSAAIMRI